MSIDTTVFLQELWTILIIRKNGRSSATDAQIWELKFGQTRLLYFVEGSRVIVLTHGYTKKQQKLPRRELDRAQRLRAEYIDAGRP